MLLVQALGCRWGRGILKSASGLMSAHIATGSELVSKPEESKLLNGEWSGK